MMLISKFVLCMSINVMNKMSNFRSCGHVNRDGDSSSGEREGDDQKSMSATKKRNRFLSFSGSESEDDDRFVLLYLALHLNA